MPNFPKKKSHGMFFLPEQIVFERWKSMSIKVNFGWSHFLLLGTLFALLVSSCSPSSPSAVIETPSPLPPTETVAPSATITDTLLPTATSIPTKNNTPQASATPQYAATQSVSETVPPVADTASAIENPDSPMAAWRDGIEGGIYMANACNYFVSQLEDYQAGKQNQDTTRVGLLNASLWATIGQEKLKGWTLANRTSLLEISSQLTTFADQLVNISGQWTMGLITAGDALDLISPQCQNMEAHMETITDAASQDGVTDDDLKIIINELFMPMAQQ
jgi:hypothetical protein